MNAAAQLKAMGYGDKVIRTAQNQGIAEKLVTMNASQHSLVGNILGPKPPSSTLTPKQFSDLTRGVFEAAAQNKSDDVQFLIQHGGDNFSKRILDPSKQKERYDASAVKKLEPTVDSTADQSVKIVHLLKNDTEPKLSAHERFTQLQALGKKAFGNNWDAGKLDGVPDQPGDHDMNGHRGDIRSEGRIDSGEADARREVARLWHG